MHIEGIRRLVREWPDSLFKDVSSSCRCPGGGGHAESTGEAGDAHPAPRPGPPVPDRAVGGPGARRDGLVGTTSASPEHWTTPSVRTRWLTGASSASHARRTRSSFPAGTSSSVRTGSSTAVRTAGGRPTRSLSSSILSGRMRSHTTPLSVHPDELEVCGEPEPRDDWTRPWRPGDDPFAHPHGRAWRGSVVRPRRPRAIRTPLQVSPGETDATRYLQA
ncbi:hypothetical protein GMRT_22142 [Giardia muris]|uniref:Uncharacterized protein n=1 Tax=Giardia muris TaxID=5742 RepID=A0A4Z1SYB9_GIAMU|nr:hypothetical protein GMRT_22142 [Giardia muris]|eukprot:TNJ28498.1 hypothetical protein GMRT_22142 [Giardia muris]